MRRTLLSAAARASRPLGYRGLQRLAWTLDAPGEATVPVGDGARLTFRLNDGYWTGLLDPKFSYEDDLADVFERAWRTPGVSFLDCGANIGYWSARASAVIPGKVRAIEASPVVFEELKVNAGLNGFDALNVAVWSRSGETVEIVTHDHRHAGSSIVNRADKVGLPGYRADTVETVTIDDLAEDLTVVKLDVEGAEIAALDGAQETIDRGALIAYEDHGADLTSEVTAHVLGLGLEVWALDPLRRITSAEQVSALKTSPTTGYNFLAHSPGSPLAITPPS